MIAGLGVELDGLWDVAVARGGHLRVGLEDAPLGCTRTSAEMVAEASRAVQGAGRPLATASEVRRATVGNAAPPGRGTRSEDRKSTRLNSSHANLSYVVF